MAFTFTPRTGVSLVHGSSLAATFRALRLLELSGDLDLDIVVVVRADDPDRPALAEGMRGRGAVLPVDPALSDSTAGNPALAGMVDHGRQYAWVLSPELVVERWTLGILTKHMEAVPDCAVVSPRIMRNAHLKPRIWSDGGAVSSEGAVRRISAGLRRAQTPKSRAADVDAVHRIGSLYRISALEIVGPFQDGDEADGHDVGWSSRARRLGWRVMAQRRSQAVLEGVDDA